MNKIDINILIKGLSIIVFMILINQKSMGQVYFGIDYEPVTALYTVSLKSDQTVATPLNSTGTAQITIRFATNDSFQVANITSLIPNVSWNKTTRVNRPVEAIDYDYITFGLASLGTSQINYEQNIIIPLFSFENVGGACPGIVEIIDNQNDAFLYPNSEKLSIRNHISILGIGGNAYTGTFKGNADCREPQVITSTQNILEVSLALYPNPATDRVNIDYHLTSGNISEIIIYDVAGKIVKTIFLEKTAQKDTIQLEINDLAQGAYLVRLSNQDGYSEAVPFVKVTR